ncbi:MAG: bifunctional precorrin-2 dehydrogenase/sirohydrochlorin ferrochelatase [Nitrososphaerota archaeon]|jgi:precorrin-2 dehydrogenase/sirohydrochlorin ferrochelatase|uniref:precorrin-2 dehydrogenase/sirohydrochlorin ferrochelatase family protein n=1 Tax=Candidatus Bathycorpusculum sp. TaxID=2994959 RepID=UPI0028339C0C|nr:bifunctional precorrin-2 dehydrogenase/sirohydrochlorin ferrochelatase [Candidatus Termiticorpusculum sp.]MCL2257025.1 bifunctional precorrin-2 dehydrogenase/sirohydrochlorin ferrochelatase [Candidatus Termiticorpusculum sp.]MCL2292850.1 bifunctional precorrin-2 dehydrogenase/sirohydrochlorin ferrochelatase [Candidatus Termiticorpusculum sp.]MDR0460373.1 bifunctional precorrin-2 dehydrogenase/sirohydrochlorin ferrochelatase [Nitrososphaerota archaeon]
MDFKVDGKTVMIIGGGFESYRKLQNFLDSSAEITVFSNEFSEDIKTLAAQGKVCLSQIYITDVQKFMVHLTIKPDLVLAVTNDYALNVQLVLAAKKLGCIVYCVSDPSLSDFILPAVARVGDVKIAVSTSGKSPVVARMLRQRIERLVTAEDLLEIELQVYLRKVLKNCETDQRVRSKLLNEILNNVDIKQALNEGKLYVAKALSLKLVQNKEATMS